MLDALKEKYPTLEFKKRYPASGQKQVFLVNLEPYGDVVLKLIKNMDERICREVDIVKQNDIPGVPHVYELASFEENGSECFYILEEYIEGETLEMLLRRGKLPIPICLELLKYLLSVVAMLEKRGIVHRDIKPANIIRGDDGCFHLLDFGIARNLNLPSLTMTVAAVGPHTPGYAAPELFQYRKDQIDSRADLFSIGVVIYEALFGKHPFLNGNEPDTSEIWYRTMTVIPKDRFISGDDDRFLMGLIKTLMQKQVSKRPPTAKVALKWFDAVCNSLNIPGKKV